MQNPIELLQNLIRFDTTNPPGNEVDCVGYLNNLLAEAGIETQVFAKHPERPSLIARLEGQGTAPPLLLYGHIDVVTTAHQDWTHPPFDGVISDGYLWGRGTLDMKGGVAMMLSALLRAKDEGFEPAGDVILACLSDEETGGNLGAIYLVDEHPELFEGVRYGIGELGGFPIYFAGQKFYTIQIAEKQICWLKATVRGPGGHASLPVHGGSMTKLANLLQQLDEQRLPVHIYPAVRQMLSTMAAAVSDPEKTLLSQLLDPAKTDQVLDQLGDQGRMFDALLHNTVNATMVRGGEKINVIPSEIVLRLDARLLPGYTPDDLIAELRPIVSQDVEFEVLRYDLPHGDPDLGLFDTLAGILREADPEGIPIPFVLFAATDARAFYKLGIQSYGFLPMNLPPDLPLLQYLHAGDERIPVDSVVFGAEAMYNVLLQYG